MVLLTVAAKGSLVSEGLGTEVTGVRPIPNVLHDVIFECITCVEGFAAALAPERFLSSVCPLMADESNNLGEGAATEGAGIWLEAGVDALMSLEARFEAEGSVTDFALVGLLSCVKLHVLFEVSVA